MRGMLFSVILFLLFTPAVYAQEGEQKFETTDNTSYTVLDDGTTHVSQAITLKNLTDEFRASEYSLELGLTDLKNIKVSDSLGPITAKIEKEQGKTQIKLVFNEIVIGKDRILLFTISYQTSELARKRGLIWEVNIPGVQNPAGLTAHNVSLVVPNSFGKPAYIKPNKIIEDGKLTWTKEEIPKSGILVAFGEFQAYAFYLKYHLKNPRLYPIQTEIALPPQTDYQKIFINTIFPEPIDVKIDSDGNWLASYRLAPSSSLTINVTGAAQVFLMPQNFASTKIWSGEGKYLAQQKYWEAYDKNIVALASSLKDPRSIYNFVVRELIYDFKRVGGGFERVGAAKVLQNKHSAICMEFTDLFIALARASGIPAREINGWAFAQSSEFRPLSLVRDVLHSWPEYYDKEQEKWFMVDPTWGNTTGGQDYFDVFDFDHLAFVIKGINSQYPIPAGGYKIKEDQDAKDIEVSFSDIEGLFEKQATQVNLVSSTKASLFSEIKGDFVIQNLGNTLLPSQKIKITTPDLSPSAQEITIQDLPPMGKQTFSLHFEKPSLLENKKAIIRVEGQNISRDFEIFISPFAIVSKKTSLLLGGGLVGAAIAIVLAWKTRSLYIPRQKRTDSLRRQSKQSQGKSRQLFP